jgi:hypothetical protein
MAPVRRNGITSAADVMMALGVCRGRDVAFPKSSQMANSIGIFPCARYRLGMQWGEAPCQG